MSELYSDNFSFQWQNSMIDQCFCYFTAAMFVPLRRAQTWRLHTKLCKFGWRTFTNNARMKNSRDLILGEVVSYIAIICHIPDSWLYLFNGYNFWVIFFVKKIPLSRRVGYVMGGWISGSVVQWIGESVDQWISGSVDQWISGSVDQWISGSVDHWEMYVSHTNQIGSTINNQSNFLF